MTSEGPFEGNVPDDEDGPTYRWLDEWLCEYVDGTMDPSLETTFEKYVEANPELKAHVERLRKTRELLCDCSRSIAPSPEQEPTVRRSDEDRGHSEPPSDSTFKQHQPLTVVGLVSSVTAALVIGFLAGALVMSSVSSTSSAPSPTRGVIETEQEPLFQRTRTANPDQKAPLPLAPPDSGRPPPAIQPTGAR